MAEALRRLYGPGTISTTASAPTTILSTVPTGKLDVVRLITAVPALTSATGAVGQVILGITNVTSVANWVASLNVVGTANSTITDPNQLALALPIYAGETLVGYYVDTAGGVSRKDYKTSNNATWTSTTTDATTLSSGNFTPQTITAPNNIYFAVANTKAASPDTVSSITDAHSPGFTGMASIVTATSGINRASIWGGYLPQADATNSTTWTITFGGTYTSAYGAGIVPQGAAIFHGTPSTGNVVRATATNTGTTETACSITTTPASTTDGFQIMVISSNSGSTATGPTGSAEFGDGTLATPTNMAAAYLISPPQTNPTITLSGAGTTWAACLIEVGGSGTPTVTVSGIVID